MDKALITKPKTSFGQDPAHRFVDVNKTIPMPKGAELKMSEAA